MGRLASKLDIRQGYRGKKVVIACALTLSDTELFLALQLLFLFKHHNSFSGIFTYIIVLPDMKNWDSANLVNLDRIMLKIMKDDYKSIWNKQKELFSPNEHLFLALNDTTPKSMSDF